MSGKGSGTIWYLGGPISFVNGACPRHSNANYNFATSSPYAVTETDVFPGQQLLIRYCGADLDGTFRLIYCSNWNCDVPIMNP
jgi:hypothetical protein